MLRLAKFFYFLIALYVCFEIIRISIPYYTPNFNRGFLIGKEEVWSTYKFALYAHIIFAPITFLLSIPQLLFPRISIHQKLGKVYVFTVLFLAGPSGLFMAFYAKGGGMGISLFLCLSILWIIYTYLTFFYAKRGQIQLHRKFAIGSFILCNSAILLRLFHYFNLKLEIFEPKYSYVWISFLSWVPILIFHEVLYFMKNK